MGRRLTNEEARTLQQAIHCCDRILFDRKHADIPTLVDAVCIIRRLGHRIEKADELYIEHCALKDDEYSTFVQALNIDAHAAKYACKRLLLRSGRRMMFPTTEYNRAKIYRTAIGGTHGQHS